MLRYLGVLSIPLFLACAGGDGKSDGLFDDTGGSALDRDEDDDGSPDREDCVDNDPTIFPGAEEIPYDGLDNDCDGGTPDDDLDGDGFLLSEDCDDEAAAVHPGATEVAGDGIDNDCDPNSCLNPGFDSSASDWSLPYQDFSSADYPFVEVINNNDCSGGVPEFATLDLSGDGTLDLVVMSSPCRDDEIGRTHWLVYEGGISGFGAEPVQWSLPVGDYPGTLPFDELISNNDCSSGRPEFGTLDITGDGIVDLVVLQEPCGDGATGREHWLVYEGGPGGFAASATPWTLPAADYADADYPFIEFTSDNDCASGRPESAVLDITGDGVLDLVVLQAPCGDGPIGQDFWRVYAGGAGGFAETPTNWSLPAADYPSGAYPFIELVSNNDCASGRPEYVVSDMDADGAPELVVLQEPCSDGTTGGARWRVYANLGNRFAATATDWSLPQSDFPSATYPFIEYAGNNDCASGRPEFVTADLAGDGVPDLAVLQSPCADGAIGGSIWEVYPGGSGGFSDTAAAWALPAGDYPDADYPFIEYINNNDCASGRPEYAVTQLNGDGRVDLVVLQTPCADGVVGREHWSVYFGTCEL